MLLICIDVLPVYVSVYNLQAWCLWSPEEADRSPGTGLTDGCELPRGCWELNHGPLQEQQVLRAEASLQQAPAPWVGFSM